MVQKDWNPETWAEMSADYKLMMGFFVSMVILWVTGGGLSTQQQLMIAGSLFAVIFMILFVQRLRAGWRWRGIKLFGFISAILNLVLYAFFFEAVSVWVAPASPRWLPWFLAGGGMCLFFFLASLRLAYMSHAAFLRDCGEERPDDEAQTTREPFWKRVLRYAFGILFLLVWMASMTWIYVTGTALRGASLDQTAVNSVPWVYQEQLVYIPQKTKQLIDFLNAIWSAGPVSILLFGALLHFGLGIRLFGEQVKKP